MKQLFQLKSFLQRIKDEQYLHVPFDEKDEAKKLGAKWDPEKKSWYAPNMEKSLIERWKSQPINLCNEDRTYGGNDLFIDLIPRTCWFTNVRYCVKKQDWERLRKHVYNRVDNKCECCKSNISLEAHERWDYDEKNHIQKLVRIVALCQLCHQSTHIGLAGINGKYEQAKEHLKKVRNFSEKEFLEHENNAWEIWRERNKIKWNLDLSLITSNNLQLTEKIPDKDDRKIISDKSLIKIKTSFSVEETLKIERQYPTKKPLKKYPERYDNFVFEKLNEMNDDTKLQNDYKKWKDGINYKTNRKIKIGGKLHKELKEKFMIKGVLIDILNNINVNEYIQETKKINDEIDIENIAIKDYNISVNTIIEKIQKLERWNDFIEFEGKKYGIP
jgi:hypothetical protein